VIRFELSEIRFEGLVTRFDLKLYAIRFDYNEIWQQIADTPALVMHTALLVSARELKRKKYVQELNVYADNQAFQVGW